MNDLLTTTIPRQPCPYCLTPLDCATAGDPAEPRAVPKPGDVTVCIMCASPLRFDENLHIRALRKGEFEEIATPELHRVMAAVRSIDRRGAKTR